MKPNKFALVATIKNIEKNIDTYRTISGTLRGMGIEMYQPWLVDNYPMEQKELDAKMKTLVDGTKKLIRSVDFIAAEFSEKSRTVFLQTIMALENKIPVICLIKDEEYKNFPDNLLSYGEDLITVKTYKTNKDIESILEKYIENLEPPKKRFNIVLRSTTLKQLEQLCVELDISKAELIRRLVAKEYRRIFEE